ncbi:MAG: ADP-forming succinate--CoA ligase subunit beta [Proteobacteria bacterium]|nr:ADP-forming succinate--CoA ligase subunit beta [Pseudomonadota bacterium]MBU4297879.1 ADP-forming succinate--CoA ligase subunit beta [Pseudomonadota bacterium]MCG2750102.1 ADP-forming succinate--CoA ligase subunit beta [Desulfobulbaceae bacterium]
MKIHEFQAKELFRRYSLPVPGGGMAITVEEALAIADEISAYPLVVKAQIHAGGRGKGGGVKLAANRDELQNYAGEILGMTLVTPQTGPEGRLVQGVLVEQAADIVQELYLSLLPDRATATIVIMASSAGGMDIEETATTMPDKIIKVSVNPLQGLQPHHVRQVLFGLGIAPDMMKQWSALLAALYRLFVENDCSLVEINPLAITGSGSLLAVDAKIELDDNALFRHADLQNYRDSNEEDPLEAKARQYNLNYIRLSGNVGNMVNGAGLAMATMDIIKKAGADPANFLDVGGGATAEMVEKGFEIILSDPNVKGIFINIFGGILRCDVLATGIVEAVRKCNVTVPLVIRMEGTNVEQGRKILADSGLQLITAVDMADAAAKVAEMVA